MQLPIQPARRRARPGLHPRVPARRGYASGFVAHHRHALDDGFAFKVVQHKVLGAAVVPDGDGAGCPAVTHAEARVGYPLGQVGQQRFAFGGVHLDDAAREMFVDIQRAPAGERVHAQ